jgi:hypothetical protein
MRTGDMFLTDPRREMLRANKTSFVCYIYSPFYHAGNFDTNFPAWQVRPLKLCNNSNAQRYPHSGVLCAAMQLTLRNEGGGSSSVLRRGSKGSTHPRAIITVAGTQQVYSAVFLIWNLRSLGSAKPTEPTALVLPTGLE